ncbi:MAG: GvpL/GvpF family gas vesicle protein [Bradyrhizobium sp.]
MSGQHLIGLIAADDVPADLGNAVIPCGTIAAAIRSAAPPAFASRESLDHHAAVVAWCRRAAFLPSRAGIPISPELLQSIARSAWFYRSAIEHVEGRVEISVEIDRRDSPDCGRTDSSGRGYLRAAAVDLRACEVGIATAASLLAMYARRADADLIARTAPLPAARLRASVLVRRAVAPRLAQQLDSMLNAISARLVCRVTGPWPPYSFSKIPESS